ncbi:MAG: ankyrin repeat domain-containing protein, partial [Proteobacteria bacterium]|nr:ankyrin repeat domain-containing protein [Pseudomonadota bacterium]
QAIHMRDAQAIEEILTSYDDIDKVALMTLPLGTHNPLILASHCQYNDDIIGTIRQNGCTAINAILSNLMNDPFYITSEELIDEEALYYAIVSKDIEAVEQNMSNISDINKMRLMTNSKFIDVLNLSILHNQTELVETILENCGEEANKMMLMLHWIDRNGNTAIGVSIKYNRVDMTQILLEHFSAKSVMLLMQLSNNSGQTPIHNAVINAAQYGDMRSIIMIIDKCGVDNMRDLLEVRNAAGQTPLDLLNEGHGLAVRRAIESLLNPANELSPPISGGSEESPETSNSTSSSSQPTNPSGSVANRGFKRVAVVELGAKRSRGV